MKKIFEFFLISFILFSAFSVVLAAPLPGQTYPYKASNCNWDGKGDKLASLAKDSSEYWCVPSAAQQPTEQTGTAGTCGDPNAFKLTPIESRKHGTVYWCLPISESVTKEGIKNIECPAGSQIQKDINGNPIGCFDPSKTAEQGCGTNDIIRDPKTNQIVGCRTQATKLDFGSISGDVQRYTTSVPIPCQPIFGGTCPSPATPAGYIARLYQFGLMIVGLLAFGSIVYGSIKYILSAGSLSSTDEAKDIIREAIYGLILLLGAFLILYTINPNLVNLRNPQLEEIKIENIRKDAQVENGAEQRIQTIQTGADGNIDSLCESSINTSIDLNISSRALNTSGQKTGSFCLSCVPHAKVDAAGVCVCDSGYVAYSNSCVPPSTVP